MNGDPDGMSSTEPRAVPQGGRGLSELPRIVSIVGEGSREGLPIAPGPSASRDGIALADTVSAAGPGRARSAAVRPGSPTPFREAAA